MNDVLARFGMDPLALLVMAGGLGLLWILWRLLRDSGAAPPVREDPSQRPPESAQPDGRKKDRAA